MQDIIAKPKMTKMILDRYDLKALKRFGQNFLIDANIVEKIAKIACDIDTTTIEIGPGIGALTQFLARYSKKVYAHEIDKKLVEVLSDNFKDDEKISIIEGDFLKVDFKSMPYAHEKVIVCANLPYYITTPILFKLFESELDIEKITVMVQKEVADRFIAKVGTSDYSALSVIVAYKYDVKFELKVPKTVFDPKPKVDSAVISFLPKEKALPLDEERFYELIKASFRQRRKTLKNNLSGFALDQKRLNEASIDLSRRAQELSLDDFIRLYGAIYES